MTTDTLPRLICWTGGSRPAPLREISAVERRCVHALFRKAMGDVFAYWGDYRGLNPTALGMARIQWGRARYDAHASVRAGG